MTSPEKISNLHTKVLAVVQQGFPDSLTPYKDMAEKIQITCDQLLEILRIWQKEGTIRRVGAVVNHIKTGWQASAMVAWKVGDDRIEQVGALMADFSEVSHAYRRKTTKNWPYDLYTMVHCHCQCELKEQVEKMSNKSGVSDYRILQTVKELKKVPPTYICQQ